MPQLHLLGRSWMLGSDDFSLVGLPSILLHFFWFLLACSGTTYHATVGNHDVILALYVINAILCLVASILDMVIVLCAMRGAILQPEKRSNVSALLCSRIPIGLLIFGVATCSMIVAYSTKAKHSSATEWYPRMGFLCVQVLCYAFAFIFGFLISQKFDAEGNVVSISRFALRLVGASNHHIEGIIGMLMQVLGGVDLVPTDLIAGIYLLAADQCEEGILGEQVDASVLEELHRFAPFAMGIYGCPLSFWGKVTKRGTSLLSSRRFFLEVCKCLPCLTPPYTRGALKGHWFCARSHAPVEKDCCCCSNTFAMRRMVAEVGNNIEVLWASWEVKTFNSLLPMAVLLDHSKRDFVITVRGTANISDCVTDIHAMMEPYHPACLGARIDDGAFKAHSGMLSCMQNAIPRLQQAGVLQELEEGGCAHGFRIVCTGHSLGAGVAALLALELRGNPVYGENVHFVGYEPPRACLSPELAAETRKLGWYFSALLHDWVPRVNVRSVQQLREEIIDKLRACHLSKFQVMLKFSGAFLRACNITRAFARLLARCRRDPSDQQREVMSNPMLPVYSERELARNEPGFFADDACSPGNIVVVRSLPEAQELFCCGYYSRDVHWTAEWGQQDHFKKISIHPKAVEYHFPHVVIDAISDALVTARPRIVESQMV